jgi:hypothetical protein
MGEDRDAVEIIGVCAREDDIFPGHVEGEIGHFTQIKQQIDWPLELDRVIGRAFELLVISKREFRVDCDSRRAWAGVL